MKYLELENELKQRIKKRRVILGTISAVFLVLLIVFWILYLTSGEVTVTGWGPFEYRSVTYNENLKWGMMVGLVGFIYSIIFFILDLICSKFITVEVNADHITFYRGLGHVRLYVNGELKDGLSLFKYYLEAPLSDGSRVNVSVGRWSAHMTFTNGHSAIDV